MRKSSDNGPMGGSASGLMSGEEHGVVWKLGSSLSRSGAQNRMTGPWVSMRAKVGTMKRLSNSELLTVARGWRWKMSELGGFH